MRSDKTGEVIFTDTFTSPVAGIVTADYNMDGKEEVIVISTEGEVRGYAQAPPELQGNLMGKSVEEEALRELNQKKQVSFHHFTSVIIIF